MRKQVAYEFRLLKVSATDPNATREMFSNMVNGYLAAGWELFKTETVHYEANDAFVAFHFLKYEDVQTVGTEEPVRRGRKTKIVEETE